MARITAELRRRKHDINHKKVLRMMRDMNLQALYPKPKTTLHNPDHKIYPYLLRDLEIIRPNRFKGTSCYTKLLTRSLLILRLLNKSR